MSPTTLEVAAIGAILSGCAVFAQAGGGGVDPGLVTLIGNLGVVGVLVWHLYHTTQAQPKASKESLERFSQELKEIRQDYQAATERLQATHDREIERLTSMLLDNLREYRRAVHDTREVAQQAINQTAAVAAEKQATEKLK